MTKINTFLCLLLSVVIFGLLIIGCESEENRSNEDEYERITNTSKSLTNDQAKDVFKNIQEMILATYNRETYKIEDFSIEFVNEADENNTILIDINVDFDMTLIRQPKDSPFIKGMQKALSEVDNDKEKEIAQNTIDGFLLEIDPYYNKTNRENFPLRIEFQAGSQEKFKYNLFYLLNTGGEVTMHPAKEYFDKNFKEDAADKEKMGYDIIKEQLGRTIDKE